MNCLTEFDVESAIKTWREDGFEDGKLEGKQEKAVEAARNLYANGVSLDIIAKSLNMRTDEIEQILSEALKGA